MKRLRTAGGFSMAELLAVVAILIILFAVIFVAVVNHMKSLDRMEYNTIAKEIFIAAQNHLTTAESQGYLSLEKAQYGLEDTNAKTADESETDIFYFYVENGLTNADNAFSKIFELMLPFGSIDDTVRLGGSYLIRYQPSSATVLDVFYSNPNGRYGEHVGSGVALEELMSDYREGGSGRKVIGWYGNAGALEYGRRLKVPTVEVRNAETLEVIITDNNHYPRLDGQYLKLIIEETVPAEGSSEPNQLQIPIYLGSTEETLTNAKRVSGSGVDGVYTVVLDDIARLDENQGGFHFYQLDGSSLLPGENITVYAVTSSSSVLTNVARSIEITTNSLFADLEADEESGSATAKIANIRHLENLDYAVSHVQYSSLNLAAAEQISDLIWSGTNGFTEKIKEKHGTTGDTKIYLANNSPVAAFYPVSNIIDGNEPTVQPLNYDGKNHSISEIEVSGVPAAGVFGTLKEGSVSNLLVYGGNIQSADSGKAGGLIGSMTDTAVSKCASTAVVRSSTSGTSGTAGGLIGEVNSTATETDNNTAVVKACYAAGHTFEGSYKKWIDGVQGQIESHNYDVTGATAGGLIGAVTGPAEIQYCYSTCSVSGSTAGGFVGNGASAGIVSCYCTGQVAGSDAAGAFAGAYSGSASNCSYFGIINEIPPDGDVKTFTYLQALPGGDYPLNSDTHTIAAFDEDIDAYNTMVLGQSYWKPARPYDVNLGEYYTNNEKPAYNLKTVEQLAAGIEGIAFDANGKDVVQTHYGDWPAPEIFVINSNS